MGLTRLLVDSYRSRICPTTSKINAVKNKYLVHPWYTRGTVCDNNLESCFVASTCSTFVSEVAGIQVYSLCVPGLLVATRNIEPYPITHDRLAFNGNHRASLCRRKGASCLAREQVVLLLCAPGLGKNTMGGNPKPSSKTSFCSSTSTHIQVVLILEWRNLSPPQPLLFSKNKDVVPAACRIQYDDMTCLLPLLRLFTVTMYEVSLCRSFRPQSSYISLLIG